MGGQAQLDGPELDKNGLADADLAEGAMIRGQAAGEAVLVARRGERLFAIGATCTHYGGPLSDGILVGDGVRCPWHHACFSLETGAAVGAPALNPVACWKVERRGDRIYVTGKDETAHAPPRHASPRSHPARVVIVGAGAAGNCAAEMLRAEGYEGAVTMVGREDSVPYDRPNLSKDYLAGSAPEEWIPLRPREFYAEKKIELRLGVSATAIDAKAKTIALSDGQSIPFDALLLATGADPVRLSIPGLDQPHVHYLRSLGDSRALIAAATGPGRVVVIGASFIGLEVAAAMRARGLEVDVVAPETRPLEKVLGPDVGELVRALHESHGVRFHLGEKPATITRTEVVLASGKRLTAHLVVIGVGVRPATALAEAAGLTVDNGVVTDEFLETSVRGIFAAGDIARYPNGASGEKIRVEHWVVAQRQGQAVARAMLGKREAFTAAPFFWSQHYDVGILYTGHAARWDAIEIAGSLAKKDCTIAYREGGVIRAIATIGRDKACLLAEAAFERSDHAALEALLVSTGVAVG